ncbi:MAG: hypothetical protein OEY61_04375 [Gammaproteobacteria bacterium]|nr:hypothetical protein [Gammaproteobacteria bacterium]
MSYDILVDEQNRIINITWNGTIDLSTLKRHMLSYNYHMTHTDHYVLYDFRNVSDIVLSKDDISQAASLSRQVFDPLLKDIKVALLTGDSELEELTELFIALRKEQSVTSPDYGFYKDFDQAMSWLLNSE